MYAVIETGGKQYKVQVDDLIDIEKIEAAPGDKVTLDKVLAIGGTEDAVFGTPTVDGASVDVEFVETYKAAKVNVFKMKRRKSYRRLQGHRQQYSTVKVTAINTK